MTLKSKLGLAMMVVAVVAAGFAAAASLGSLSSESLGADSADVFSCDSNGVSSSYVTVEGAVTNVTVDGIAGGCNGAKLSLTLLDATSASIGAVSDQTLSIDSGSNNNSVTVAITPQPAAGDVTGIHIAIVGPS